MAIKQDSRLLAIKTALGPDVLGVKAVTIQEGLSGLFQIEADLSSEKSEIDFDKVIGQAVTLRLDVGIKQKRYFHGFVSRFSQGANKGGFAQYTATIVPWFWFLTRTSDCYIFQAMSVPEIIEDIFKHYGFSDYKLKLTGKHPAWDFCVQYRETDFNFLSRLMEQEGIYYYFEHEDGKHTLILADAISAHNVFPNYSEIAFFPAEGGAAAREAIQEWTIEKEAQPVAYALQDFDFTKPKTSLLARSEIGRKYGKAQYEVFDYPGEYDEHEEGENLTDLRLNELQSKYEVVQGEANARGIAAGCTFKFKNHPRGDQNKEYLVVSTTLHVDAGEFSAGDTAKEKEFFSCSFTALDKTQQFRPPRITPKPIVQGPQTAIVVGPAGEEIFTDKYGRVKVHFHWDRHDKSDENSSFWIRVSQYWAGKEWGSMHIPRIGQEVIVEFLEGDPDQPIITGRVYNAEQMPPYGLPANKTQSGVKSRSTPGGGGSNFNELRFEDKKGGEEVFLHGEKDWTVQIKNCENKTVGSNISANAGANISASAGANISRTANENINDTAGQNITTVSGKNMGLKAGGSYELWTNLGIHLKAMNFIAEAIESGAKAAAAAIMKGAAGGAAGQQGLGNKAGGAASGAVQAAQTTGLAALGPAISGVSNELSAKQAQAGENMAAAEAGGQATGEAAGALHAAISSGASSEVIAGAAMGLASAAYDTYKDAKKLIEDMLPQIPSIVLWAMKDINATALWSMSLETKARDITVVSQNKDINLQAKKNVNVQTKKENISLNSGKNIQFEAAEEICIKTGDAKIVMKKDGSITIEGKDIVIKGSGKMEMKADSDITVKGSKVGIN